VTERDGDSKLGAILRSNMDRILAEQGLTVADFLKMANITRQRYSAVFKSDRGPTMQTLQRWARLLGVDMSELTKETT
jgi:transcriptional regulator with XRE-family HTH domain